MNNFEHQVFGRVQLNDYSTGNLAANQTNLYAGTGTYFDSIQKLFPNKEVQKTEPLFSFRKIVWQVV